MERVFQRHGSVTGKMIVLMGATKKTVKVGGGDCLGSIPVGKIAKIIIA